MAGVGGSCPVGDEEQEEYIYQEYIIQTESLMEKKVIPAAQLQQAGSNDI